MKDGVENGETLDSYLQEAFIEIDCEMDSERKLKTIADTITDVETKLVDIGEIKSGKDPEMVAKRERKAELTKLLKETKRIFALTKKNIGTRKKKCEEANRTAIAYINQFRINRIHTYKECYKNEKSKYRTEKGQLQDLANCFPGFKDTFVSEKDFLAELKKRLPE